MAVLKCKMCGGDLNVTDGVAVIQCEYCGTRQTVPNADNEKKLNLFNRANRLRIGVEFDKAASIYESIVAEFPEEAEAYWGLCLCNYGIEYVDDPATAKKIPTCHRASFESLQKDENFELALEYADVVAQKIYRDEAREIDRIMSEILAVSKSEKPYDVFICYKETDEKGERTPDSVLAHDIYDALTAKGLKVFFARITLEDKLGRQYEPYIFAALNSAKVMLSIGTKYEYFHAVWVKNEWSRFLKLMAKDKSKVLIPCFKDIDAYDMPDEFRSLQAQDLGKLGAIQDLVRGVEKIVGKTVEKEIRTTAQIINGPNVEALLKRGYMALEDGSFDEAKIHFDKVLNTNAECAEAYLGLAMIDEKVNNIKLLIDKNRPDNRNYQRAKQFAPDNLKAQLEYLENEAATKRFEAAEKRRKEAEEKKRIYERDRKNRKIAKGLTGIALGFLVALKSDGTVMCSGKDDSVKRKITAWSDIVSISAGWEHVVGLKADGTVVAAGKNKYGENDVETWNNIVQVVATGHNTLGLKRDGTVVIAGKINKNKLEILNWKDITELYAYPTSDDEPICGLRKDGRVEVVCTYTYILDIIKEIHNWRDIVSVAVGKSHVVGLKSNGKVVAVGECKQGQCRVSEWQDIVQISAGYSHTVGVKFDGTVVSAGADPKRVDWKSEYFRNVASINTDYTTEIYIYKDGTVLCNSSHLSQYKFSDCKLFDDFDNLEEEQKRKIQERRNPVNQYLIQQRAIITQRQSQNLCQHCGGQFKKGFLSNKCTNCGKEKDY